ncbi:MAG: nuclear transport factor 2 family protein [Aurantibacter sp.]
MKKGALLLWAVASLSISAQENDKVAVQKTIEDFFAGFHAQDSMQIKATVAEGIIMQRIGLNKEGEVEHRTDDFGKFLKGIVGIPKERKFEEKIKSYSIQIDGAMANAWTEYEFWIDGQMHHCGVNSFQLLNEGNGWKIIYLIDTGRKEGCE